MGSGSIDILRSEICCLEMRREGCGLSPEDHPSAPVSATTPADNPTKAFLGLGVGVARQAVGAGTAALEREGENEPEDEDLDDILDYVDLLFEGGVLPEPPPGPKPKPKAPAAPKAAAAVPAPAPAAAVGSGGESLNDLLIRLHMEERGARYPRSIVDLDVGAAPAASSTDVAPHPAEMGRVYKVWGKSFKVECRIHKKCTCFININWCIAGPNTPLEATQSVTFCFVCLAWVQGCLRGLSPGLRGHRGRTKHIITASRFVLKQHHELNI